jgi:hypothetical protein
MKSFADWTQELAESVGPVEHHWETRKEAELKEFNPITTGYDLAAPIPDMQIAVRYDKCDYCNRESYLFDYQPIAGFGKFLCKACLDQLHCP